MNFSKVFSQIKFHKVIELPAKYEIYDFSTTGDSTYRLHAKFGVGKYNERRATMYTSDLFGEAGENHRNIHMGIDIGAQAGTPVFSFYRGSIFCAAVNSNDGDYGGTIITEHQISGVKLWALHGHLSCQSVQRAADLQEFEAGDTLGWIGDKKENGGWPPHLHFQLSTKEPLKCDMLGVVSSKEHLKHLSIFIDPRVVLGKLY